MPSSIKKANKEYFCSCERYCNSRRKKVSKASFYRHKDEAEEAEATRSYFARRVIQGPSHTWSTIIRESADERGVSITRAPPLEPAPTNFLPNNDDFWGSVDELNLEVDPDQFGV